jgi:microcystin-dependent protein
MPLNTEFKVQQTDYVLNLEAARSLLNSLISEWNTVSSPSVQGYIDSFVTQSTLNTYLQQHPINPTTVLGPASIDITQLNCSGMPLGLPAYVDSSMTLTAQKISVSSIMGAGTDGFIVANGGIGSVSTTTPTLSTQLPSDELLCIKDGNVVSFPSSNDPDIADLFQGVNNSLVGSSVYFGSTDIPAGWIIEDGREVLRAEYPMLYNVIGNRYGTPSNTQYFKVPDKRGLFLINLQPADADRIPSAPGGVSGIRLGSISKFTSVKVPDHTHSSASTLVYRILSGGSVSAYYFMNTNTLATISTPKDSAVTNIAKVSSEFRPKNIALVSMIRGAP